MVLATDMAMHAELTAQLFKRTCLSRAFDFSKRKDKSVFCNMILHAADISNAVRPFGQSKIISIQLSEEFKMQAEVEVLRNLPVLPHMVLPRMIDVCLSEISFLQTCAGPYWIALATCFSTMHTTTAELQYNIDHWEQYLNELQSNASSEVAPVRILGSDGTDLSNEPELTPI